MLEITGLKEFIDNKDSSGAKQFFKDIEKHLSDLEISNADTGKIIHYHCL